MYKFNPRLSCGIEDAREDKESWDESDQRNQIGWLITFSYCFQLFIFWQISKCAGIFGNFPILELISLWWAVRDSPFMEVPRCKVLWWRRAREADVNGYHKWHHKLARYGCRFSYARCHVEHVIPIRRLEFLRELERLGRLELDLERNSVRALVTSGKESFLVNSLVNYFLGQVSVSSCVCSWLVCSVC